MADPPGKVLSSLTSPNDTRHSKLSGCAGSFFQFFDWNLRLHGKRLFRHNLLPAERPKQFSTSHNNEKLPMAKLLLIADENRGGVSMSSQNESGEAVPKHEALDVGPSKRTPSVIARLMGLETMPSPEPRRERNEDETNICGFEYGLNQDNLPNRPEMVGSADWNSRPAELRREPFKRKAIGLYRKPLEKYPGRRSCNFSSKDVARRSGTSKKHDNTDAGSCRILIRRDSDRFRDPKRILFTMLPPPLPPQQADTTRRSILSPSESHNKLTPPIKNPLASKGTVRVLDAAGKVIKPRLQSIALPPNYDAQSEVSELEFSEGEEKVGKNKTSAPLCPKRLSYHPASSSTCQPLSKSPSETSPDQKKRRIEQGSSPRVWHTFANQSFGSRQDEVMHRANTHVKLMQEKKSGNAVNLRLEHRNPSKQQVTNRRVSYVSSSQEALPRSISEKEEAAAEKSLGRSTSVKEGKPRAQCNRGLQELGQARAGDDVRSKPDFRKQEHTSRRLSQPVAVRNQNFKRSGTKPDRTSSSQKGRVAQSENLRVISPQLSRVSANVGGAASQSSDSLAVVFSESVASSGSTNSASIGTVNQSKFLDNPEGNVQVLHNVGGKCVETAHRRRHSSLMRSLLKRRAETEMMAYNALFTTAEQSSKFESETLSEYQVPPSPDESSKRDESSELRDGAAEHSSSIFGESFAEVVMKQTESQRINVESASCSHSSLGYVSDFARHPDLRAEGNIDDNEIRNERVRARWGTCDSSAIETLISESTIKSSDAPHAETHSPSCWDFSLGNFRDTFSRVHPIVGSGRRESVSYSGKTTAAILQELLVALNSSRGQLTLEEKVGEKAEDSRISGTNTTFDPAIFRQPDEKQGSVSDTTEYTREHACHSTDLQAAGRVSDDFKEFPLKGGSPREESDSVSDSLCAECGQPSPVSILESPFQYESSNSSDSFESTKERKHREGDGNEHFECTSTIGSQTEDGDSAESGGFGDCDELIDTISRLHRIDPSDIGLSARAKRVSESEEQYVKEILSAAKVSDDYVYSGQMQLSASFIDQAVFNNFEEQVHRWEWGICCPEEDDAESHCRSEMESHYEEAAALNRKLIFDCVSDALRLIFLDGRQVSGLCLQPNLHSPATYMSRSVHRQMNEWKGMACSMNVDTMVEKEMNTLTGSWCDFCDEVSEIAVELERNIFRGLIEELVTDMSKNFCKVPTNWVGMGGMHLGTVSLYW